MRLWFDDKVSVERVWTWAAFPRSWCTRRRCLGRPYRMPPSSAGRLMREVSTHRTDPGGPEGGTSDRLALVNWKQASSVVDCDSTDFTLFHRFHLLRPRTVEHNWETMKSAINDYIGSLNWGYRVALRDKSVNYANAYAEFVEPHKIKVNNTAKGRNFRTLRCLVPGEGAVMDGWHFPCLDEPPLPFPHRKCQTSWDS